LKDTAYRWKDIVREDLVNHPPHYTNGDIECIDAMKASMSHMEFSGYLKGNVIKYIWRYRDKGKLAEDLDKALWYANRLKEEVTCHEKKSK
jgi:hypothetical protein